MRLGLLAIFLVAGSVQAHVPAFDAAGSSPQEAFVVDDPDKSWVFYDELTAGQHWFRFEMDAGAQLSVSVQVPAGQASAPTLWLLGPGFDGAGPAESPPGVGATRVPAASVVSVEPFSPIAMRTVAQWRGEVPESGTHYVVVESQDSATYSLGLGARESFTPVEWATVPVERIGIQAWGGIPWPLAILGEALALVAIAGLAWRRGWGWRMATGRAGAAAIAGTALTTAILASIAGIQGGFGPVLVIPFLFAAAALGIGWGAWRSVQADKSWGAAAWGAGALLAWAGLLVGPLLLFAWSAWGGLKRQRAPKADQQ